MNRRGFLSFLSAAGVTLALPDAEVWFPQKTIFLPPAGGWSLKLAFTDTLVKRWEAEFFAEYIRKNRLSLSLI